jgi:hypothetical protein
LVTNHRALQNQTCDPRMKLNIEWDATFDTLPSVGRAAI